MLGYPREQLLQMRVSEIDPDYPEDVWAAHRERMRRERLLELEPTRVDADGNEVSTHMYVYYYNFEGDEFIIAAARDITERKKSERDLQRTQQAVECSADGVFYIRSDGEIQYANAKATENLGYSRAELCERSVADIDPLYPASAWPELWKNLQNTGSTRFQSIHQRKDGSRYDCEISAHYLEFAGEQLVIANFRDITEQKHLQEIFEVAVQAAPTAMLLVDVEGIIKIANNVAEQVFGYSQAELIDQSIQMLIPERYRSGHARLLKEYFSSPESRPMGLGRELYGLKKDQTEVPIEIALNPIVTAAGTYTLSVIVDTTERLRKEKELKDNVDGLAKANEELEQFAYIASHDLQEPLRKVRSFCQLLEEEYHDQLDTTAKSYLGFIIDGAARMRNLITDLLDYSRIATQGKTFELVDLAQACAEAAGNLQEAMREQHAEVVIQNLPTVHADYPQVVRLFQNLISNAIKYHRDDSPRVQVGAEDAGASWTITVRDNGLGIDPKYFERIFLMFQRLHAREEYSGTGIGLAICKRIVDRLKGRIWVESNPGEGSTFFISIPKQVVHHYDESDQA